MRGVYLVRKGLWSKKDCVVYCPVIRKSKTCVRVHAKTRGREEEKEWEMDRRKEMSVEAISGVVVDCAFRLHVETGPGLLESVYEVILARMLEREGLAVTRQVPVPIELNGMRFDEGFKVDIVVEDRFLIELKSVEKLAPVHGKQLLTYLR